MVPEPRWYTVLPAHLRPPEEKIELLEELRIMLAMRDEAFLVALASTPWAVVRSLEVRLDSLRGQFPDADERRLWTALLFARLEMKLHAPASWDPPEEELRRRMETIGDIMRSITSWDQMVAYILDMDREGIRTEPGSPQAQIHSLLTT
ncbi:MAG: hypothetical protein H6Q31_2176 [Bacteroidetes bacterium]|nr:hypothetical protein [Bacteroidota bacterium]